MRQYRGTRGEHGCMVTVEDGTDGGGLDPRFDLRAHADGFNWGYAGGGPAQLALAMCADVLGDDDRARDLYQTFKFRVVAHLPADGWVLSEREVLEHLAGIDRERQARRAGDDEPPAPPTPVPPLARRIDRQLAALAEHPADDATDRLAVMRERGWLEAVRHFVARGELTHAGQVEAGQFAAASEDWLREQRGEPAEGMGR